MADTPASTPLSFSEFTPLSTAAWQERIRRDLKGQDPETLRWHSPEGVVVEPFYHREALDALATPATPQVRAAEANAWLNVPTYLVPAHENGHAAIDRAAEALQRGADGAHFDIADTAAFDVAYLAQHLPLAATYVGYSVRAMPLPLLERLLAASSNTLRGFLRFDPVTDHLLDLQGQLAALRTVLQLTQHLPEFKALTLNGAYFGNRGGTATQQLAFALSTAAYYLDCLPSNELEVATVAAAVQVQVAINPSYFTEIAKLRALRRLWATLLFAHQLPAEMASQLRIYASTATWSQTTLDPPTNLLRTTTEAMAAVVGGADAVSVTPFDSLFAAPNAFADRLARNIPTLLRSEAHLQQVADPAAGSYYLETLTDELARNAWALFQEVQAAGGVPRAARIIINQLQLTTQAQFRRIATGEQVIVGTNRYQNPREQFSFNPKRLLRSADFDSTRAAYPSEVLQLATALHFQRREKKMKRAAVVLLGAHTNQHILESFLQTLPAHERPELRESHPEGTVSVLFSSSEEATLMYATPEQFSRLARLVHRVPADDASFMPSPLLTSDLATLQEAVQFFGFKEFVVEGYSTEDVLARLQGKR
ncbi:methylmalonyl-CoA mutase family protein [Hymenobacter defluvii]|uniref:Methylmalonyl-CoA mutase alpha/beta chain catalytic domain-containing protein n=1 Tax=Hymenobacter defluvii TaxID=2054411 RepID=A0ABS3TI29_9BACT|nr:methylmalonyl-CoA mutase family protein [Hymenobacter defluvii]MBO3273288.1 hypothetical protein [Hymenobacter defluvii]